MSKWFWTTFSLGAPGNISWHFWKFRNYKDLYGKPYKRDWMAKVVYLIQMLPTFSGRCNRYFWDIRLKLLRLPNFNMLFQANKIFQKWTVFVFAESWSRDQVMQEAYCTAFLCIKQWRQPNDVIKCHMANRE